MCPTLKRMTRVVEKARLRGGKSASAACVKDIVRGMVVVDSMDAVASLLKVFLDLQMAGILLVVRVKERFLEAPSAGGWRGLFREIFVLSSTDFLFHP